MGKLIAILVWIVAWVIIGLEIDSHAEFFANHLGIVMLIGLTMGDILLSAIIILDE